MSYVVITSNGSKYWYDDDFNSNIPNAHYFRARYTSGSEVYWSVVDGVSQRHRLDGPAYIGWNGEKLWFYKGKFVDCSSQQEFEKIIKLIAFW